MKIEKFKILVLLKPGDLQPAVERANEFARFMPDIEITACRIINDFDKNSMPALEKQTLRELKVMADKHPNIKHFVPKVIFSHEVAPAFVREAHDGDYTMAIISANKRNTIRDLFVSTIDSQIMNKINVPLLVVKDANAPQRLGQAILVAIDFEESDHEARLDEVLFQSAKIFAEEFNGEIHIANCVTPLHRGYMAGDAGPSKILHHAASRWDREDVHEAILHEFADKHGIGDGQCHVLTGRIDEEIPRLCRHLDARMVCMGTSPKSGLLSSVNSTASELVLEQIKGDLFTVNDVTRFYPDKAGKDKA